MANYLTKQNLVDKFATYADNHGLKRRNILIEKSHKLLERHINSRIIYNILDEKAWTEYLNMDDPVISTTLNVFRKNAAFPRKESTQTGKSATQKVALYTTPDRCIPFSRHAMLAYA